jgi:hypothetical protein
MSSDINKALAAAKKRLVEEERQRKERELWRASPAGQHGKDFGTRLGPWILELARTISEGQRIPVAAMHITRRIVRHDDVVGDWPCGRGEFEGTVHRFPIGSVERGFRSTPFLVGCRCPPHDAWGLVIGSRADQDGLLSYGILPDSGQYWFTPADLGDVAESSGYFDGSPGHDQIAPGEVVVHVAGVRDSSDEPADPPHPCSLGSFSLARSTNFFFPLRSAELAFRATLEGFLAGQPLVPQFNRRSP